MSGEQQGERFDEQQNWGVIGLEEPVDGHFEGGFWRIVSRVLKDIFNADPSLAEKSRQRLRQLQDTAGTRAPRSIFYHASPLEVAADLAGRKSDEITAEERKRYFETAPPPEGADCPPC